MDTTSNYRERVSNLSDLFK